ncbi:MAG: hypothetical protein JNL21_03140 [Myxococcales bacterium]|nr:hypothetical protein [Myxococcales bacterium]
MTKLFAFFGLALVACGTKAEPTKSSAAAPPPPASSPAPALAETAPRPTLPSSATWPEVAFASMKISFRRAPSLVEDAPAMTQDAAARWGSQIWSMSTKTKSGVDIAVAELGKGAAHDRKRLLDDMRLGAVPQEVVFEDDSAVVKRSRVLGKKSRDGAPQLSDTHVDLAACKKLGDSDFCSYVAGGVDLSLGRPGLSVEEAMEVVAFVRSIERK